MKRVMRTETTSEELEALYTSVWFSLGMVEMANYNRDIPSLISHFLITGSKSALRVKPMTLPST